MFKRRNLFGILLLTATTAMIAACSGSNNPSNNGCNGYNTGYNTAYGSPGYNPGYNPGASPYGTGGCNGAYNSNINRNIPNQQQGANPQIQQQTYQLQNAVAQAQAAATRADEELRQVKESKARKAKKDSDDDSSSDPSSTASAKSTDSNMYVVISGATTAVPTSSHIISSTGSASIVSAQAVAPAAQTVAPQAQQQVVQQQVVQQQVAQPQVSTYTGVNTIPVNGSTINQTVIGGSQQQQVPATQTVLPQTTAPAQPAAQQDVNTPTDISSSTQQLGSSQNVATAAPAAPATQASPNGPLLGQKVAMSLPISVQSKDTLPSFLNADGMSAFNTIMTQAKISKASQPVMWTNDADYETRVFTETVLQLPTQKVGKKTITYASQRTMYVPKGAWNSATNSWQGLWQEVQINRLCDIETRGLAGACLVLERDERNDQIVDRGYILGGFRKDPANDTVENYQVVREDLPASVQAQVHTLLYNQTEQGIFLITPSR
jgi:hypothetical protein